MQVQIDAANKPMYEVAQRVLSRRAVLSDLAELLGLGGAEVLADVIRLAEYVCEDTRPKWNP